MPGHPPFSASFSRSAIEPLEARIAPAAVVAAHGQTVTWTDIDGDIVTLHVSKSLFNKGNVNSVLTFDSQGAQQQLLVVDLTKLGQAAADVDLKITAAKPIGGTGNDKVDVGFIKAAIPRPEVFAITKGIDLGLIKIDGDLGGIYAGDQGADAAVQKIAVGSWGTLNTQEQTARTAGTIPNDLRSIVLASVKEVVIKGNFDGTFGARLDVLGGNFGRLGSLDIGGDLKGGAAEKSGLIFATDQIGTAEIRGNILGGSGSTSGNLQSSFVRTLHVGGSMVGGTGDFSGRIVSGGAIETVRIDGSLIGGGGIGSAALVLTGGAGTVEKLIIGQADIVATGQVTGGSGAASASIQFNAAELVKITGSLTGGSGGSSAQLKAGAITRLDVGGSLLGGSAQGAGAILINSVERLHIGGDITGGTASLTGFLQASQTLGHGVIEGNLTGGSAAGGTVSQAGTINGAVIQHLEVQGNLTAGTAAAGAMLISSGAITASLKINTLTIDGNVTGHAGTAALISATGQTVGSTGTAIKTLTIMGNVDHANILAGYGITGTPLNADAQIGTITLGAAGKTVSATNIVAGATQGADGIFGTAEDARIAEMMGTTDRANVTSRIVSIIIAGTATNGSPAGGFGIVADQVQAVKIGSTDLNLQAGKYNDRLPVSVPGATDFQVVELAPPAA